MARASAMVVVGLLWVCAQGCGDDDGPPGVDAGGGRDAGGVTDGGGGVDAGPADAGAPDAGEPADAGPTDAAVRRDGEITLACTLDELTPIAECARMHCISLPDGGLLDASLPDATELATCILTRCGTLLLGVSPMCRDCLVAGVGMNVDEITMRCADGIPGGVPGP